MEHNRWTTPWLANRKYANSGPYHRARLLAAAAPHSGDWLHTLPITACGLHLNDNAIRVAVGLRLGCAICEAHCCPCGVMVDALGQHALSYKKQSGRVQRHAWLSDLIHRAMIRAQTPAVKESPGSQQRRPKETRWLVVGTVAVGVQCHVRCDSCSHTGNILRVAKCATGRKCCSGRVCEKDDQV